MTEGRSASQFPIALTIAGSDPSGGAGIQADLKTFTVLGVYGASVITALTAQSTRGVSGIVPVPPDFVSQQIATLVEDMRPTAVKTGMLYDAATVRAVAEAVKRYDLHPLVVDPVMVATSGDSLMSEDMVAALRDQLLPLADLLTPNLPEAARLAGRNVAAREHEMILQARALMALGCKAVVVTGGHAYGREAIDILVDGSGSSGVTHLELPRVKTKNTHGTGCTFSAAVTAHLARGEPLRKAVTAAKRFVHEALQTGRTIGQGAGPVDHLHALRIKPDRG
jgi:hydroxymethylpyrimidine/phosphomethylpyrimidine kinase